MERKRFLIKISETRQKEEFLKLENNGWNRINPQKKSNYDSFWHPKGGRVKARINNGKVGIWIQKKGIAARFAQSAAEQIIALELGK